MNWLIYSLNGGRKWERKTDPIARERAKGIKGIKGNDRVCHLSTSP
jgi:hypothetical protein